MALNFSRPTRPFERRREETDRLMGLLADADSDLMSPRDRAFYLSAGAIPAAIEAEIAAYTARVEALRAALRTLRTLG